MSPGEDEASQEPRESWLAACDEALAAGDTPVHGPVPLERDVAFLRQLRHALEPDSTAPRPVPVPTSEPPTTQLGRFRIVRELGQGSFGIVYLAHDPQLNREVALKVPRAEALVTPELRQRFQREARAAAGLEHPNIVPVHEAGEVGLVCYIASAYCPGVTLAQWLRQQTEPVSFSLAAALVQALAGAVQHAHDRGVVHRDLKPGNILLQRNAESRNPNAETRPEGPMTDLGLQLSDWTPRITDFGLAKLELEPTVGQTQSGAVMGTPSYMAPEQAGGKSRAVGPLCDVYALGTILYELLVGRTPFVGETTLEVLLQVQADDPVPPSRLRPRVPRDLETICLKCLHKEPAKRYASAAALAEDLRRFRAGEPIAARPAGRIERGWRLCKRNPMVAGLLAAVILSLSVGGAVATVLFFQARAEAEHARQSLDRYEQSLARGLLRPMATHRSTRLNDEEIDAFWELAGSSEEGLRRRFVEEAIRNPKTTRQLKDRRSFALHAAVGLDTRRRERVERMLAQRLSTTDLDPSQGVHIALTLSALGELSPDVTLQAAEVLSRGMSKRTNLPELRELAQGLSAIAGRMEPKEAARLCSQAAACLAKVLNESTDTGGGDAQALGQGLAALAPWMESRDAAALLATGLIEAQKAGRVENWAPEFHQGLKAVAARSSPRDLGPAAAILTRAIIASKALYNTLYLAQALSVVAARMEPTDATAVCAPVAASLAQYITGKKEPRLETYAAQALSAVAAPMEPREAARICGPVADAFAQALTRDWFNNEPLYLAQALAALADRIDSKDAARLSGLAAASLVGKLSKSTLLHVQKLYLQGLAAVIPHLDHKDTGRTVASLVQALSKLSNPNLHKELLQGLTVMVARMEPREAGQAAATLTEAMTRTMHHWELQTAAKILAVVAARMGPEEAATACGQAAGTLVQAMSRLKNSELQIVAEGLSAVAEWIGPGDAGQGAAILVRDMSRTTEPFQLSSLALGLSAVATRMEPRAAVTLALDMSKTADILVLRWLSERLPTLAARMEPREAATVAASLDQAISRFVQNTKTQKKPATPDEEMRQTLEADEYILQVLAEGLGAVAARMEPREAATICSRAAAALVQAMSQTSDPDTLQDLAQGLSAVAARMEPEEAARVCGPVAITLAEAMSQTSRSDKVQPMAEGLSSLTIRMEPLDAAATLTQAMSKRTDPTALRELVKGLSAVLARKDLSTAQVVEVLKYPLCVGEARRVVLEQLEKRHGRPFADQWEFVRFAKEQDLGLDFTTPPHRPQPALPSS